MNEQLQTETESVETTITIEGHRLLIVARRQGPAEWSLKVQNERGINSEWFEFFNCPRKAIKHAKRAIKEEGVDAFVNVKGFEFLSG